MDNVLRREQGLPYHYDDPALQGNQREYQDQMMEYNRLMPSDMEKRQAMLKKIFADIGEGTSVEIPINANWGCRHVHLGKGIYINSNVTFVDDGDIYIGDYCLIGPGVQIMPGVKIGDNSVIGAGSVVTGDIPANVVACGVPCKVLREIGEKDRKFYYKDRELDVWE